VITTITYMIVQGRRQIRVQGFLFINRTFMIFN